MSGSCRGLRGGASPLLFFGNQPFQRALVCLICCVPMKNKANTFYSRRPAQILHDGEKGNRRGFFHGVAVCARADGRECHGMETMLRSQAQRIAICGGQQFGRCAAITVVDRPDRVDDLLAFQPSRAGDPRLSSGTAADPAAFFQNLRPARAVDRAIHSTAAQQGWGLPH